MKLRLMYYPDPILRKPSGPVKEVTRELRDAIPEMFELMYLHRGVGLAGPQAGIPQRVVVANILGDPKRKDEEKVFVNPEILDRGGVMNEEEGCLSLPGLAARIRRSARVKVRFRDLDGQGWEMECEGLWAKLFQHEIDHLDGLLMVDKMSAADLRQWRPLLQELEEDHAAKREPSRRRPRRVEAAEL
ncbi:MAG TPA: peptide deformylase [Planctomycetota bacterium]